MAQGMYRKPEKLDPPEEPLPYRYRNFSPNQAALNRILKKDGIISNEKAPFVDQGTLNSYCRRKFLIRTKDGYTPSADWFRAVQDWERADIMKTNASAHLGKWVELLQVVRTVNARGA